MKGLVPVLLISSFCLALGGWAVWLEYLEYRRAKESESWPSVRGRLDSRKTEFTPGGRYSRRGYMVQVSYTYTVDEKSYRSDRLEFVTEAERHPDEEAARAVIAAFPAGPVTVYYDPRRPAQATLIRRYRLLRQSVTPILCAFGIPAFFFGLLMWKKYSR